MSKNAYEILGVSENSSQTEIDQAYYNLRAKYRNDMYQEGALGKEAARKLTELEQAYRDVCSGRASYDQQRAEDNEQSADVGTAAGARKHSPAFAEVEDHIKAKDFRAAQDALDQVSVRDAEWHYFQAIIYYNKGWMTEAKNQMEMACNMEPANAHYKTVLDKLNTAIDNAGKNNKSGAYQTNPAQNTGYQRSYSEQAARQDEDMCCRWCQTMICLNCLCDCCCRG